MASLWRNIGVGSSRRRSWKTFLSTVGHDCEATLQELDGERDPGSWLITSPPKVAMSRLVNRLKGVSSRFIRKKPYPALERALWGGSLWFPRYFAGSAGGAPPSIIRQDIVQQETRE